MEDKNSDQKEKILINSKDIEFIKEKLTNNEEKLKDIEREMKHMPQRYVSHEEFKPIKRLYEKVSLAGIAVIIGIGAVGAYVLKIFKDQF